MVFYVQYQENDPEIAKALQILAVTMAEYAPPGKRRGGSTLAQAIVRAAIQTGQVEALLQAATQVATETPPKPERLAAGQRRQKAA